MYDVLRPGMNGSNPSGRWALYTRAAGFCGTLSPVLGVTLVAIATHVCPSFSWTENYLSLLGVEQSSRALFNGSLIAGGALNIVFAIGFARSLPRRWLVRPLATVGLVSGACALAAIGIFPRTTGLPHDVASIAFFLLVPLSLIVIGTGQFISSVKGWGAFSFACAVLMIVLQLVPWPWSGGAIAQLLAGGPWFLWLIVFGTRLLLARDRG